MADADTTMRTRRVLFLTQLLVCITALFFLMEDPALSWPSIYPRGVTICDKTKVDPGFVLFYPQVPGLGTILIDNMTGKIVKEWKNGGRPPKLLPNGNIFLTENITFYFEGGYEHYHKNLTEFTFDERKLWQWEGIIPGRSRVSGPYHHDFEKLDNGNVLLLAMDKLSRPEISDKEILDDVFFEVTQDGKVVWELRTADLYHQFGFTDDEKKLIHDQTGVAGPDWAHCNTVSVIPQNRWYKLGDKRFKPGNLLTDYRDLNIICIIDRDTKKIVWKLGPAYPINNITQIIGQHDAQMIPEGLPGAGNILIFDNGGEAGYPKKFRGYSRIIEIDPVKMEIVWEYNPIGAFFQQGTFYTQFAGNVQRLANGNTFICETWPGRLFEVTREGKIVWEYMIPWTSEPPAIGGRPPWTFTYRAYKYPPGYCPQFNRYTRSR